jgi:hypothetical protein
MAVVGTQTVSLKTGTTAAASNLTGWYPYPTQAAAQAAAAGGAGGGIAVYNPTI